jgi:outer membrane protein TolC
LALDPLKDSETYLASAAEGSPNENHPLPQSLLEMAQAADELSKSLNSDYGPSLQVSGRISRDYPNGPILETITQKTVGVNATWPLFQWGKTRYAVKEQKNRAETTRFEREQVLLNLKRDWDKAQDQLKGRRAQEEINKQSVLETKELAKLTYSSYVAGRSSYLEVQTANLRALETNIRTARTNVQILIQLAILDSIGKGNLP